MIEQYEIGPQIGRGGFANVILAHLIGNNKPVALKIVKKELMKQHNILFRVENEINIHQQLQHPNIVKFDKSFEDVENYYIVLEFCQGGTLFQYLQSHQKLSEHQAISITKQLLSALKYLHRHKIVHRDLKLSNILIANLWQHPENDQDIPSSYKEPALQIRLCDFGLAIRLSGIQEHNTLCGTPNFIAPEVASQQNHSFPADIWSIGCLFYTMITGIPPFEQGNVQNTLGAIVEGQYPLEPLQGTLPTLGQEFLQLTLQLVSNIVFSANTLA